MNLFQSRYLVIFKYDIKIVSRPRCETSALRVNCLNSLACFRSASPSTDDDPLPSTDEATTRVSNTSIAFDRTNVCISGSDSLFTVSG
jgi:hypothetical protein